MLDLKGPRGAARYLTAPAEGRQVEGRSILFRWDFRDVGKSVSASRLTVKRQKRGQDAQAAMRDNDVAFEIEIRHQQFYVLETARLEDLSGDFVWQVAALAGVEEEAPRIVATSGVRSFRHAHANSDIRTSFTPSEGRHDEVAEEPWDDRDRLLAQTLGISCNNGDFEAGNLTGWVAYSGSRWNSATISLNSLQTGAINGRHTIRSVANGDDPVLLPSVHLSQVGEGNYSLRLGDSNAQAEADLVSYTFVVDMQNRFFTFRYAVVLENPADHSADRQPFFSWYIVRNSSIYFGQNHPIIVSQQIIADASNPFFKSVGGVVYRDWTPVCVDLSAHLGQTLTLVLGTADCADGGHYGYAYIDGVCVSNEAVPSFTVATEFCGEGPLFADGTASANETSHFWSIEESDVNWGRHPWTEVSDWFIAQQAGPIDLSAFYASKGGHFKCNTFYRIKLAVSNACTPWNETVQLVYARCPAVTAGPDQCVSCTPNGVKIPLGLGNPHGTDTTYAWSPSIGLTSTTSPTPLHIEGSVPYPFTYTVTAVDSTGCSKTDQVTLYCRRPEVEIQVDQECCSVKLSAVGNGFTHLVWSTGAVDVPFIEVTTPGTYTLTASNPCGSVTATVVVNNFSIMSGPFHAISYNRSMSQSGGFNDKLYIFDWTLGLGAGQVPNAYNITDYELTIWDRWGHQIKQYNEHNCHGFTNFSICWDGTDTGGEYVPAGTYNFTLRFKNCDHDWGYPVEHSKVFVCTNWLMIFGIKIACLHWGTEEKEQIMTSGFVVVS